MKKALVVIIFLLFTNQAYADKRFEKDLKIISKLSTFVNNKGENYKIQNNLNKSKIIIILYTHGAKGKDQSRDNCKKKWQKIPPAIFALDGYKLKDYTIKTFRLCSGVRGWTKKEEDRFWEIYDKNNQDVSSVLKLKDKKGVLLSDKWEGSTKRKVIKLKIEEFKNRGFSNIILAGHSAGAWGSLVLFSNFPEKVDGVIAFNPARSGKYAKKKGKVHNGWKNWRNYKISLIKLEALNKVLVMSHNKDEFETPETLSFLSNSSKVKFLDLSDTNCKAKKTLGGYHAITLTHCFANKDYRSKEIIKYLEEIY